MCNVKLLKVLEENKGQGPQLAVFTKTWTTTAQGQALKVTIRFPGF